MGPSLRSTITAGAFQWVSGRSVCEGGGSRVTCGAATGGGGVGAVSAGGVADWAMMVCRAGAQVGAAVEAMAWACGEALASRACESEVNTARPTTQAPADAQHHRPGRVRLADLRAHPVVAVVDFAEAFRAEVVGGSSVICATRACRRVGVWG